MYLSAIDFYLFYFPIFRLEIQKQMVYWFYVYFDFNESTIFLTFGSTDGYFVVYISI